jgi:hypothetical protein
LDGAVSTPSVYMEITDLARLLICERAAGVFLIPRFKKYKRGIQMKLFSRSTVGSLVLSSMMVSIVSLTGAVSHGATASHVLNHVEMNGSLEPSFVAFVDTNSRTKKIKVTIVNDICGQYSGSGGPRCMAASALVSSFELPYKVSTDVCNSKIYEARQDLRPAGGMLTEISLTDSTLRTCEDMLLGLHVLTVNVDSLSGNPVRFLAYDKAQPSRDDGAIYEALNVEEEVLNPGIAGASKTRKSVGGLVCEKSTLVVPGSLPTYSCSLAN